MTFEDFRKIFCRKEVLDWLWTKYLEEYDENSDNELQISKYLNFKNYVKSIYLLKTNFTKYSYCDSDFF